MVLINHQLFIHGGLIGSSDECDLGGACPSDLVTIVNLDSGNRTGRPTVSFKGSARYCTCLISWGMKGGRG